MKIVEICIFVFVSLPFLSGPIQTKSYQLLWPLCTCDLPVCFVGVFVVLFVCLFVCLWLYVSVFLSAVTAMTQFPLSCGILRQTNKEIGSIWSILREKLTFFKNVYIYIYIYFVSIHWIPPSLTLSLTPIPSFLSL